MLRLYVAPALCWLSFVVSLPVAAEVMQLQPAIINPRAGIDAFESSRKAQSDILDAQAKRAAVAAQTRQTDAKTKQMEYELGRQKAEQTIIASAVDDSGRFDVVRCIKNAKQTEYAATLISSCLQAQSVFPRPSLLTSQPESTP
jgi:hypothetical protein